MELTQSYLAHVPAHLLVRYEFREVRKGAAVIASTNPELWREILGVMTRFTLERTDLTEEGGNKSDLVARIDRDFRELGWRESRVDTVVELALRIMPYEAAGETEVKESRRSVENEGYKVDNFKGRLALDVEWNAKDGNLDRDLAAYRSLYEFGLIDAAVLITRTHDDLRQLALRFDPASTRLKTTTTTNLDKLEPRLQRGDAGGCPVLAIAICKRSHPGWEAH